MNDSGMADCDDTLMGMLGGNEARGLERSIRLHSILPVSSSNKPGSPNSHAPRPYFAKSDRQPAGHRAVSRQMVQYSRLAITCQKASDVSDLDLSLCASSSND
jgi:hypothetical protein